MQKKSALAELFELLEEYAPAWYSEEHHNRAMQALGISLDAESLVPGPLIDGSLRTIHLLPSADASRAERSRAGRGARRASPMSGKGC